MRVLGLDVLSGNINSKTLPKYSVVLLEDGEVIVREELDYNRLLNFISMMKPDFLGIDNVLELFPKDRARKFFIRLPDRTRVLQVNGGPGNQEPLHVVARRYGIPLTSRGSSMEEAEASAHLANLGVGHLAELFENRTRIVVSRARSMGKGGQSKDRYRRKVHHLVALNVKTIEQELNEQGVEYSLETKKADLGLERGSFVVKSRRSRLKGIKNRKGPDVQIKVTPVEKRKLSFRPLREQGEMVILGVDPGTTTSISALDLEGRVAEVISRKEFSLEEALLYAQKFEKVCLVAADVSPPPRFVSKLASKLNVSLFVPPSSLTLEEKRKLVEGEKDSVTNPHERDSLAAALKAFKAHSNKVEQLEKKLKDRNSSHLFQEAVPKVLSGESLEKAVEEARGGSHPGGESRKEKVKSEQTALIKSLKEEIEQLKTVIQEQDREKEEKDRAILALKNKMKDISTSMGYEAKKEKMIRHREAKIDYLDRKLREEKELRERIQGELNETKRANLLQSREDLTLVKVAEKFNLEEVMKFDGEGEVFLFRDSSGAGKNAAERLLDLSPRAIIAEKGKMSHLAKDKLSSLPIISPGKVNLKFVDSFALARKEELEKLIAKEEERLKITEAEREKEKLERIIDRYREEREVTLG